MNILSLLKKRKTFPNRTIEELKSHVKILFIDDENFNIVKQLKEKDGWRNIIRISDLDSMSQTELLDAHVVLVDIQGVGKKLGFKDGGLGIIQAIHHEYPEKKIIMYSAESQGQIDAFHSALDLIDGRLRKTASRYEFASKIEHLSKEAFCLDNCVKHVKKVLLRELNVDLSEQEIRSIIENIYNNNITEPSAMAKYFNLSNIGSAASIIQLLMSL